ncbi:GNAT family N-acetyltransferase [Catenulispora yoronensis]|uniref:GNAT family N-acetyltransferase n=1 Tax=Catenulispora yoronensis TaxID=450799 RepID=A0ABN2UID8_9ACTN
MRQTVPVTDLDARATELKFRTATLADVPLLVALVESAYRGESSRAGWTTEADLLDGQRTDVADVEAAVSGVGSRMIVGERGGEVVACCQLQHRGVHAYFGMFAVRPGAQGGGVGKVVLAEAERVAREELGVPAVQMMVLRQRADLIAWYVRRGYVRTGVTQPFPYGDERFGRPRTEVLEFEVLVKKFAES